MSDRSFKAGSSPRNDAVAERVFADLCITANKITKHLDDLTLNAQTLDTQPPTTNKKPLTIDN